MNRIIFTNHRNEDEELAQFLFCNDMEAFWNSEHFKKEYQDKNPQMEIWGSFDTEWRPYENENKP